MAITKSNKLELSLDHNKPNEKIDAHCYTLVTSEESQTLILKLLSSLGLLHSLALQRCLSAEQMSKSPLKEVEGMYLYTPQTNPTVTSQLSKTRTDRTCWST
jgi:hypothetical protein